MFPEEWTNRQALSREIVYLTIILVLARMAYLTVPFIQGLVLVSALGACAAIIVLLGPVGPRKLCAVLVVLAVILVWALYYFAIVLNQDLGDPRLIAEIRNKFAILLLACATVVFFRSASKYQQEKDVARMNPGTWSNAKAFLVTVLLSVLSVASIVAVNTGEFSQGFGLFIASVYGLLASLVLVLGPVGLRKLYAALLITTFVVGWMLYPGVVANGGTVELFNLNDITGGVTMWFWLIIAVLLLVFYALGYRVKYKGPSPALDYGWEIQWYKKGVQTSAWIFGRWTPDRD